MTVRVNEIYAGKKRPDGRDVGDNVIWFDMNFSPPTINIKYQSKWTFDPKTAPAQAE